MNFFGSNLNLDAKHCKDSTVRQVITVHCLDVGNVILVQDDLCTAENCNLNELRTIIGMQGIQKSVHRSCWYRHLPHTIFAKDNKNNICTIGEVSAMGR